MTVTLDKPGLYYDDAGHPAVALQILNGDPISRYWSVGTIEVFGHTLPIWGDYEGTVSTYALIPFFVLLGATVEAIRIYGIAMVISTTVFTYLFAKEMFGDKVGLTSAALFALTPSVILLGKIPSTVNFVMCPLAVAGLYFLIKWKKGGSPSHAILGFVMIGFGISTKVTFWWIPLVLVVSLFLFRPKLRWTVRNIILSSVSIAGGASIFLIYLAKYYYWFIPFLFSRVVSTPTGSTNFTFISNLVERIGNLNELLSGDSFSWTGGTHSNLVFAYFFVISLVVIIAVSIKRRDSYAKRSVFLVFVILFILVISTVTISDRNFWQIILLFPHIQIIMALFIILVSKQISRVLGRNITLNLLIVIISAFLIAGNIITISSYEQDLKVTGGVDQFSSKIYSLVDYLKENKFNNIVVLDWGFTRQIYFLSDGKIIPKENVVYPGENFDVFVKNLEDSIKNPDTIYVKYYKDAPVNGTSDELKKVLSKYDKKIIPLKTFKDWDGSNLYYVFKIG